MFPAVAEYRGTRIERRPPGFEFTPSLLGKITTYLAVAPSGGFTVFAFMYSFLVTGGESPREDELAQTALLLIQERLESGVVPGDEHTFELTESGWAEVWRPRWWMGSHPASETAPDGRQP